MWIIAESRLDGEKKKVDVCVLMAKLVTAREGIVQKHCS